MKKSALALMMLFSVLNARPAYAIQAHTANEGYIIHQLAHLIFIVAMIYTIVMLGKPLITRLTGWRYIRLAAFFFLLWNLDTFVGHIAEQLLGPPEGYIHGSSISIADFRAGVYYYSRLIENFFLVPAFVLMAVGLARLKKQLEQEP